MSDASNPIDPAGTFSASPVDAPADAVVDAPLDERQELRALIAGVRERIDWHRRGGVTGLPRRPLPARVAPPRAPASSRAAVPASIAPTGTDALAPPASPAPSHGPRPSLPSIRADLGDCTRCGLSATRNNIVFGVGNPNAPLVFVGEGPGADEDRTGEPFVGQAGQLLTRMIQAMGFEREDVYICNIVKCRPPGNRDPLPDEIEACEPFLIRQLEALAPRVIVTLGKFAAQVLLRNPAPISALRGRFHRYQGIALMPTFHPAYLLRDPSKKREVWSDLQEVMKELDRLGVARGGGGQA